MLLDKNLDLQPLSVGHQKQKSDLLAEVTGSHSAIHWTDIDSILIIFKGHQSDPINNTSQFRIRVSS